MSTIRTAKNRSSKFYLCAAVILSVASAPYPAHAVSRVLKIVPIISLHWGPKLDANGNPIYDLEVALDGNGTVIRDAQGNPIYNKIAKEELRLDPAGAEILALGADLTFDPTTIRVVTDLTTSSDPSARAYGFMCDFSVGGSCPSPNGAPTTAGFGDPLPGSTWTFSVDNTLGRVTLDYDFSTTPVTVNADTNFFGFTFEPIIVGVVDGLYVRPAGPSPFTQHPDSPDQYCITADTRESGLQCSTAVPEPQSWILMILGFGALGVALRGSRPLAAFPAR